MEVKEESSDFYNIFHHKDKNVLMKVLWETKMVLLKDLLSCIVL